MVKANITIDGLIDLLEKRRLAFMSPDRGLFPQEYVSLEKANSLLKSPPPTRNTNRKKARGFLLELKQSVSPDAYVLCAIAVAPTRLGSSNLNGFVEAVGRWWRDAIPPTQLTKISQEFNLTKKLVTGKPHCPSFHVLHLMYEDRTKLSRPPCQARYLP